MSIGIPSRAVWVVLIVGALPPNVAARQAHAQPSPRRVARAATTVRPDAAPGLVLDALRSPGTITVDGRLAEPAWQAAAVARDFIQQRPTPNAPATQHTEARVLVDAEAVYVAFRLMDSAPDSILAPLGRRDSDAHGDWAHVVIDSYHDRRTAFRFAVNAAGTRRDGMLSDDADWSEDMSWDAVWDVATRRDSLGWSAEFRIPLTQLRFAACRRAPAGEGGCAWGIQFIRDLARRNERSLWAPIPPDANGYVSRFGTLTGIDSVVSSRRLEVTPYSVARVTREPGVAGDPFRAGAGVAAALGTDVKLGVTSNLTLTATLNPDFGQVEADPSEVNLTGFETFLREQRPFFVEGGDIFRLQLSENGFFGQENLFYSRRIGRVPQLDDPEDARHVDRPDATTIVGAAKLSGKARGWSIGVLDAVTGEERARYVDAGGDRREAVVEPRTNYAVARLARNDAHGLRSIGAAFTAVHRDLDATSREHLRSSALSGGLDWRLRTRSRNYTFGGNLLASTVRGSQAAIASTQRSAAHLFQRPDNDRVSLDTTRTAMSGVSAELRASKQGGGSWRWGANGRVVTSGFEVNDIGFQLRSDVAAVSGWVGYVDYTPRRWARSWDLWLNQWSRWSLGGEREITAANLWGRVALHSNWEVMGELTRHLGAHSTTLLRGGPSIRTSPNVGWWARIVSDRRRAVSGDLMTRGQVEDEGGWRAEVWPSLTVRPSSRAELIVQPGFVRLANPAQYVATESAAGDTSYLTGALTQTTASLTMRVNVAFTPVLSLQLYAQPFLSAGGYDALREVRSPRARRLGDRFHTFDAADITAAGEGSLRVDRGPGRAALGIDDPEFSVRELRSNAVLRWEYRPGSALFLVWSQARESEDDDGRFDIAANGRTLWRTPGTNVLLLKASYWFAP